MLWDIFCRVIDNFGDIGVCWRLSADLAARGHQVRLWADDASALQWMAPGALQGQRRDVQVLPWSALRQAEYLRTLPAADVWVEGFGCEIPEVFLAEYVAQQVARPPHHADDPLPAFPVWINLEYLSAEDFAERAHGLPSPVMSGPAKGGTKHFFYPGFTEMTGGLLREANLQGKVRDWSATDRSALLQKLGIPWRGERLVSLFCYEPSALQRLLQQLADEPESTILLVTSGRAQAAVRQLMPDNAECVSSALAFSNEGKTAARYGSITLQLLPPLPQTDFDYLLWSCDLNFVRGEDSLVRALWAGKPFVWHIYPQDDGAHGPKLEALLNRLQLPDSVRRCHQIWNGLKSCTNERNFTENDGEADSQTSSSELHSSINDLVPLADYAIWVKSIETARAKLWTQGDLTTQLVEFVAKKR